MKNTALKSFIGMSALSQNMKYAAISNDKKFFNITNFITKFVFQITSSYLQIRESEQWDNAIIWYFGKFFSYFLIFKIMPIVCY